MVPLWTSNLCTLRLPIFVALQSHWSQECLIFSWTIFHVLSTNTLYYVCSCIDHNQIYVCVQYLFVSFKACWIYWGKVTAFTWIYDILVLWSFVEPEFIGIVLCPITLVTGIWYSSCTVLVFLENTCAMTCVFTLTAIIFWTFMLDIYMYFKKYFPTFKKYLPTFQTLKLFIAGDFQMSYLMLLQCAVIRKLFFTMLTFVWFFTCMNSLVLFENI